MKKKISVFAFLLSLILSLFVPLPAVAATETTADDVKYRDIEDFMHSAGYTSFSKADNAVYVVYNYGQYLYVVEVNGVKDLNPYFCLVNNMGGARYFVFASQTISSSAYKLYKFYNFEYASKYGNYEFLRYDNLTSDEYYSGMNVYFNNVLYKWPHIIGAEYLKHNYIIYSDLTLFEWVDSSQNYYYDSRNILFESSVISNYTFPVWCNDADLNALASTNESPTKIPYSYNSYWHIVRKTSNGKWLLTTIGNSVMQDNIDNYKLYVGDNGNLHVASIYGGEDENGYILNVRQYEYDTDGWKVRTYDTYDTRDYSGVVDLGAGSGFDDIRKLAYTNVDIFVGAEYEPTYPKSTEYYEVTTTPPTEEPDSPTPIPTTVPDNDSSGGGRPGSGSRPDTGGQATGGGGLDFIINLFTLIWTKICSIPMAVDGYSISLQQIIVYGALVSIVGGFIMHFIFGRK